MKYLSVVVPVYNSVLSLDELVARLDRTLAHLDHEILLVNDCSPDASWAKICALAEKYPRTVRGFNLSKNFGQHNATLCGFHHATGEFVVSIDDDLQLLPEEIPKLLATQQTQRSDVVYGIFAQKKHLPIRNLGSYMVRIIVSRAFGTDGRGSSFRLVRGDLARKIAAQVHDTTFLDGLLFWSTNAIARVEVEHRARQHGRSGYTAMRLIRLTFHLLFNFTSFPLKFVSYCGAGGSFISVCLAAFFIVRRFYYDVPLGFTAMIVSLFFIGSLNLIALGVIGEYVRRVFNNVSLRPSFYVNQVTSIATRSAADTPFRKVPGDGR